MGDKAEASGEPNWQEIMKFMAEQFRKQNETLSEKFDKMEEENKENFRKQEET